MTDDKIKAEDGGKGAGSLSEILRLQAVALARMSERMTAHQTGDPGAPSPVPEQRVADERREAHLPVLASDAALSDESLPVLNTFKKFLEAERRRARRRVVWVSLSLALGFAVALVLLVRVGRERIGDLRRDIGLANTQLKDARTEANEELRRLSTQTETQIRRVAESSASQNQDIWRNVVSAQSLLSSNLSSRLGGRDAELDQLREKVSALEIENAMLAGKLKELTDTTSELQENYAALMAREAAVRPPSKAIQETVPETSVDSRNLPLLINSPGYGRPVQLRVPLAP